MISLIRRLVADNRDMGLALLLATISLLLLILPQGLKFSLADYIHTITLSPFEGISESIKDLVHTNQTNRWLRKQLMEKELEIAFAREARAQNERLRDSLGFRKIVDYDLIPAELVAFDPKRRDNAVLVKVKVKSDVAVDQAVVGLTGLVGRTTSILDNKVTVELLTSPNCMVAARDQNTRALGIIMWNLGQELLLDNVPVQDSVAVGDTIITSGLGGLYPAGLPIGTVEKSELPAKGFFKRITIKPFVNFNRLDELFILKERGW